jgi:hypothetical protein
MKRLYFTAPTVDSAKAIVHELLEKDVPENHIHVIAREGTPMEDLPEAGLRDRSDIIPALERGAAIGGTAGALAGLAAVTVPGLGVVGGGAILALAAAGTGVGAWASSLMGISTPNSRLKRFHEAIEHGQLLMLVDVPRDHVDEVKELVRSHHPEAEIADTEPTKPTLQ